MKIQILISKNSWANSYKKIIKSKLKKFDKNIKFISNHKNLKKKYDINIIFSYFKIIPKKYLFFSKSNLVPHESKLPKGKGMSPLSWQILKKKKKIYFSLIEADTGIDNGVIYYQKQVNIKNYFLYDEIKMTQLIINLNLIQRFLNFYKKNKKMPNYKKQRGRSTYYPPRTPSDNEININDTIKNQFNLLRLSDNKRYPSFFTIYGKKFFINLTKQ